MVSGVNPRRERLTRWLGIGTSWNFSQGISEKNTPFPCQQAAVGSWRQTVISQTGQAKPSARVFYAANVSFKAVIVASTFNFVNAFATQILPVTPSFWKLLKSSLRVGVEQFESPVWMNQVARLPSSTFWHSSCRCGVLTLRCLPIVIGVLGFHFRRFLICAVEHCEDFPQLWALSKHWC